MQVVHALSTSESDSMGVTTALREVLAAQVDAGLDVGLIVQGSWPGALHPRVRRVECGSWEFPSRLARLCGDEAILHSHVPWRLPALAPLLIRRRRRCFVLSPHGSFSAAALAVNRARKAAVWPLFSRAIRRNDLFVANSAAERVDVTAMGFAPTIEIAHPLTIPERPRVGAGDRRVVAFLGRIHPIKGVRELVEAWLSLDAETEGWLLRISGPVEDRAYAEELRALARDRADVEFGPAVSADERWRYLARADLVAVPSKAENFCYVVAEALAMRTPVLTTLGVPWPEMAERGLGWRGEGTVAGLRRMIAQALATTATERDAMGERGHAHVESLLSARAVGMRYADAYGKMVANRA